MSTTRKPTFRPAVEGLEDRRLMTATLGSFAPPAPAPAAVLVGQFAPAAKAAATQTFDIHAQLGVSVVGPLSNLAMEGHVSFNGVGCSASRTVSLDYLTLTASSKTNYTVRGQVTFHYSFSVQVPWRGWVQIGTASVVISWTNSDVNVNVGHTVGLINTGSAGKAIGTWLATEGTYLQKFLQGMGY
jgi:hypothetical protein